MYQSFKLLFSTGKYFLRALNVETPKLKKLFNQYSNNCYLKLKVQGYTTPLRDKQCGLWSYGMSYYYKHVKLCLVIKISLHIERVAVQKHHYCSKSQVSRIDLEVESTLKIKEQTLWSHSVENAQFTFTQILFSRSKSWKISFVCWNANKSLVKILCALLCTYNVSTFTSFLYSFSSTTLQNMSASYISIPQEFLKKQYSKSNCQIIHRSLHVIFLE